MAGRVHVALISLYSTGAIGLRYLKSILKQDGVDVSLIFFKELYLSSNLMNSATSREHDLLIGLLKDLRPDIVGIGLRSSYFKLATWITDAVKKEMPVPVVWGGTHPTIAPDESIKVADMICMGEGEHALSELAKRIAESRDYSDISNTWVKSDGQIIKNDLRPLIRELDALPFPDYGREGKYFIENDQVLNVDPALDQFNLNILASRGCPYQCSYCCNSVYIDLYEKKGPRVRRRSVDNVMAEILTLRPRFPNLRRVDFIDEVFAWDRKWTARFTARYKQEVTLPFQCSQHPNMVDRELLHMLKDAGLERVELGIQSGSERVRKQIYNRPVSDERIRTAARSFHELKVTPFLEFIINNPFEDEIEKAAGLELLLSLPRPYYLRLYSLIYFPNTGITTRALAANLISLNQVEGNCERAFHELFINLKHPWPSGEAFWISVYSLASKSMIPKWFVRHLSRSSVLRKHPRPLVVFADAMNTIKLAGIALKWLIQGKPVFQTIVHTSRKGSSPVI
jgi:anaerobic magnesium-protoporphyrin IX monomethyl ester cyclase